MTVYEHYIWSVESPLNEEEEIIEWEEPLQLDPSDFETYPLSSLQQRMFLILGVITILVVMFGLLVLPPVLSAFTGIPEVKSVSQVGNTAASQPQAAPVVAMGAISPIFSPSVQYWGPQIVQWAAAHNLDPNMVATVMQIESCGDPHAVSRAGAQGLFQVMPFHFANGEDMLDPDTNASRGMAYLAERLVQTNGDTGKAFAGYNGGHVAAGTDYANWVDETQRYFRWATTIYADAQAGLSESPALSEWMTAGGVSLCNQALNRLGIQ